MSDAIIKATQRWLTEMVIEQNFCPFAQKPFTQDAIRYHVNASQDWANIQQDFTQQLHFLNTHNNVDTTLFIVDWASLDFYDYLDGLMLLEQSLENAGFEGVFQIASFHPDYQFEGEAASSPSHYTNRSPLPIYHILREDSLSQVLDNMPNAHTIPEDNVARAQRLGKAFFEQILTQARAQLPDER